MMSHEKRASHMARVLLALSHRPEIRKAWFHGSRCHVTVGRATRGDGMDYRVITVRDGRRNVLSPRDEPLCISQISQISQISHSDTTVQHKVLTEAILRHEDFYRRMQHAELRIEMRESTASTESTC